MTTTSKLFYDRLAGFTFAILMIGLIGYQLLTLWFIGPIFLVLLYAYYKRLQLLDKDRAKSAMYTLVGLLAILGLYVFYGYRGV